MQLDWSTTQATHDGRGPAYPGPPLLEWDMPYHGEAAARHGTT
jgi:hypothetical protein